MTDNILNLVFAYIWQILKAWWWVLAFYILWRLFWSAWLWWRQEEVWERKQEYVLLEIIPPIEMTQPIPAMEQVFSVLWGMYSGIEGLYNLKKKWWKGRKLYYLVFEIAGFGPNPHLYVQVRKEQSDQVKAAFFGQYPNIELNEADDYTRNISQNVPTKDWDIYGLDETLVKSDVYPIKTYKMFFEEKPEMVKEEKRMDPLTTLLEGINELKEGNENLWVQIRATPVTSKDNDYIKRGKQIVDDLIHRAKKRPSIIGELMTGPSSGKEGKVKAGESFIPPEMKLTMREKEIVQAIENKIGKPAFEVNIRILYFGKPGYYTTGRRSLAEQFFNSFSTRDLNSLKRGGRSRTKVEYFFAKRGLFAKKRNIFWRYVLRETPRYPLKGGTFILNTEELATIFHPPIAIRAVGSRLPRVESRKGEPPPGLPVM